MACKRRVDNGCLHALVLDHIEHRCNEVAGAPHPRAARLKHHLKPRITCAKSAEHAYEMVHVIALAGHEVTASEVDPLHLSEIPAKLLLKGLEHFGQVVGGAFAQSVEVESLYTRGQGAVKLSGCHSETRAGQGRVVYLRVDDRTLRVDPQSG